MCGLTELEVQEKKVKCPNCPSLLLPVSVATHNEYCSGLRQQREAKMDMSLLTNENECELDENGRRIRQSAKKY